MSDTSNTWNTPSWQRTDWLWAALLAALTLAAYLPAMQGGFIWDDDAYVTGNPMLTSVGGLRRIWFEVGATPQYYPLVHTSYWLEYRLWGLAPLGYHAVNVLLHACAAVLAWRLLLRLHLPGAWLVAAAFALHPVNVESVAWISERKNVLSGVLYLAAAIAYLRFDPPDPRDPPDRQGAHLWRFYLLAGVLFAAALFSKTVTASLPAALALVLWWKRGSLAWRDVAPLLPLVALGIGLGGLTVWVEKFLVGASGEEWSLSFVDRVLVAGRALWFYATKLAWPFGLSFEYPRWKIDASAAWQYLYPLGVLGVVACLWTARERLGRGPLVAVLFFAGTLFPALGFIDVFPQRFSFVADHFQYLASLGLLALAVGGVASLRLAELVGGRVGRSLAAAALAALGFLTWQQAAVYRDSETLWLDTLAKNPDSYLAHSHLGNILLRRGEQTAAMDHYLEAHRIKPRDVISANNLAWAYATSRDPELRNGREAVRLAELANEQTGRVVVGLLDTLAASYAEAGRFEEAVATSRRAIALARAAEEETSVASLRARLRLYRSRRPFRERGPEPDLRSKTSR